MKASDIPNAQLQCDAEKNRPHTSRNVPPDGRRSALRAGETRRYRRYNDEIETRRGVGQAANGKNELNTDSWQVFLD